MKYFKSPIYILIPFILLGCSNSEPKIAKKCDNPTIQHNSVNKYGINLYLEIKKCKKEGQPVKIRAIATNHNGYPVTYEMPNIGSPAIYTSISNKNFTVSRPTNPNDSKYVSPALDHKNIQPNEKIVRETTWNNTLSQGMVAPNGDYKVSVIFRYVGDANTPRQNMNTPKQITTSVVISKKNSQNYVTPVEALDKVLKDTNIKKWLDRHEGILCKEHESYSLKRYQNGVWQSVENKSDSYSKLSNFGIACNLQLRKNRYTFLIADKKDVKQKEMVRYIDLISGKVTQAR